MLVLFIFMLLTGHPAESSQSSVSGVPLILHNMYKETLKDTVIATIAPC